MVKVNISQVIKEYEKSFFIDDRQIFDIIYGNFLESGWLIVLAPPSNMKSSLLIPLKCSKRALPIDGLTRHTLISGAQGAESVMNSAIGKVIIMDDTSTLISLPAVTRNVIYSQLRKGYDGKWDFHFGGEIIRSVTGEGKFGCMFGATGEIERDNVLTNSLGERFMKVRPSQDHQDEKMEAAQRHFHGTKKSLERISKVVARFLKERENIKLSSNFTGSDYRKIVRSYARFTTVARTHVHRHHYTREIEELPEPESPSRFIKQLMDVASGVSKARDEDNLTTRGMMGVRRLALDCIPVKRMIIMRSLLKYPNSTDTNLSVQTKFPRPSARRIAEELVLLGLVDEKKEKYSLAGSVPRVF